MATNTQPTEYDYNNKLSFHAEWFDFSTGFKKNFLLHYYPCDSTLALYDTDRNRIYLRRTASERVHLKDVFIGNTIRIYGRQVKITDYADCHTRTIIGRSKDHTIAIVKPSAMNKLGEVLASIEDHEFQITKLRMCLLPMVDALDFYDAKKGSAFLPFMIEHIVSGPIVVLELVGHNAVDRWREVMGPVDPVEGRKTAPHSLRARYGIEQASNGFHGSDTCETALAEADFFFPRDPQKKPPPSTVRLKDTTCCVVKPHAIKEGKLGYIVTAIDEANFVVTAMIMMNFTQANADEFLEVYKGVVSDFHALLMSFLEGPCVALEIAAKDEEADVHAEFRMFAGPTDSEVARQIRPKTLRARFGVDKYKNAVHCTDLAEDTVLELEYLFKILDGL